MSGIAFFGALELGVIYGITALGVFLTFRVLDFPDLTVESSFPLGGAVAAACIVGGMDAWTASLLATISGALAGMLTAFLAVHCGILHLLAGILTMIAGFSINLRIMGRPNISLLGEETIFTPLESFGDSLIIAKPVFLTVMIFILILLLTRMLLSESGLAMRAAGGNAKMLRANGGNPGLYTYLGLMMSNALVALSGALFAQANGFADVTTGIGTIIFGLAAVILGETLIRSNKLWLMLIACLAGAVFYRLVVALVLGNGSFGLKASDLNLVTATLVALALVMPKLRARFLARRR
ncbi:MAG: ABC transporter permease [Gammaproteobacteria bacterium WSBS_2016_MAG_OTU1]